MGKNVYLDDGTQAELVTTLENGVHLVRRMIEVQVSVDDFDYYPSEFIEEATHIHDEAPRHKYDSEVTRLRDLVEATRTEEREARERLANYKNEQAQLLQRAELNDAVKYVFDFLDGKITHFIEHNYNSFRIVDIKEGLKEGGQWYNNDLRLLTLSANDNRGQLSWKINAYRDGSGSNKKVTPCSSYEEAVAIVGGELAKNVTEMLDKYKADLTKLDVHGFKQVIETAALYEIGLPEEFEAAYNAKLERDKQEKAERLRKELAELET